MTRLLGRVTSINARKALWALDELGEQYEREDWGLPLRDPQVPQFLALNPNGMVPVLVEDDGLALWESNAILVHLALTRGSLLPQSVEGRARALQWLGWQASDLNGTWGYAVYALLRQAPGYDDARSIASSVDRWTGKMEILEAELAKGGPFIAGDTFSIADIALGLSCHRWFMTPFDKPALKAVADYYQRLKGREAGARWMPEDYG